MGTWNLARDGVTAGTLLTFLQCREKCRLRVVERLSRIGTSPALYYGSLIHEVLDKYYSNGAKKVGSVEQMVDAAMEAIDDDEYGLHVETEQHAAMALSVLPTYFDFWYKSDAKFRWLDVEHEFDLPMKTPAGTKTRLRGKIDGVFLLNKGLWILETKTASRIDDSALVERLPFDLQTGLYLYAVKQLTGIQPKGVIYNILRKPQLRQTKNETFKAFWKRTTTDVEKRAAWYFIRYEIRTTATERDRWEHEFESMLADLENWSMNGNLNYRNSNECQGRYGSCEYLPICSREDRSHFVVRKTQFPELTEGG